MKKSLLSLTLISIIGSSLIADNRVPNLVYQNTSVGGQVGIYGLGLNVKGKFNDYFGVRAGFDKFKKSDIDIDVEDETGTEVNYNFDVDLNDIMFVADYHPWRGSFKIVGGLIVNGSNLEGVITPKDSGDYAFEFNGHTYTINDIGSVDTKVDWDPVAPYLGIGWDTSFGKSKGWGFTFDAGVAFQGSATAEYKVNFGEGLKDKESDSDAERLVKRTTRDQIKNDLDVEMKELQDDLDDYKILPYISMGFNYKF
jgi:hypothetical protein